MQQWLHMVDVICKTLSYVHRMESFQSSFRMGANYMESGSHMGFVTSGGISSGVFHCNSSNAFSVLH